MLGDYATRHHVREMGLCRPPADSVSWVDIGRHVRPATVGAFSRKSAPRIRRGLWRASLARDPDHNVGRQVAPTQDAQTEVFFPFVDTHDFCCSRVLTGVLR